MLKKILVLGLGTTVLQVLTYIILVEVGVQTAFYFDIGPPSHSLNFGISMAVSIVLILILTLTGNILTTLVGGNRMYYTVIVLQHILFILFYFQHGYLSKTTIFILGLAIPCMLLKLFYDRVLAILMGRPKSSHSS